MTKPKILIISDSAKLSSGMGVAHLEIANGLHQTGKYQIASFGWFWGSAVQNGLDWNLPWPQYNIPDNQRPYGHPQNWPNPSQDDLKNSPIYQTIEKFVPDVVIGIGDVWMLDFIQKLPNRRSFKFIWEFPIDGEPIPSAWVDIVKDADIPVVMSQYASSVIHNVDPLLPLTIIPRGIDLRLFYPIKPIIGKDVLRKEYLPKAVGKFVVGMFDRFQDRKQINRGVEAFSKFVSNSNREDAVLYLHMDVNDPASIEQGKRLLGDNGILDRYGVLDRTIYDESIRVGRGVDAPKLNILYNCCDVKISPTQGEGWGLTSVEAMACAVPVIATNYTTLPEHLGKSRGMLTDVKAFVTGMYNVERALVDTDQMAAQIDCLYCSPELRRMYAKNALDWVQHLDWPHIIPKWDDLIDKCLHKTKFRLIGKKKTYSIQTPFREVMLYGAVKEDTGWAITTRGFASGLESNKAIVKIVEGGGSIEGYKLDKNIEDMMNGVESNNLAIVNHMPDTACEILKKSKARFNIAFFPFELPRLDPEVVHCINRNSDLYLAPSKFCVDMARNNGIRNAQVLPIHSDIDIDAEPFIFTTKKSYKFLCLGNLGDERKNVKKLIKAYLKMFSGSDDVVLILKSLPGHKNSDPTEVVENESIIYDNPADVVVIHKEVNPSSLYKSCDCLVQPSRTEGFCAPVYEAMHFGMPIITTNYGGQTTHPFDYKNIEFIPFKMEDAKLSPVYKRCDKWAEIDFKSLCVALKKAYDNKKIKDSSISVHLRTWDDVGKDLINKINTIQSVEKTSVYFENQEYNLWNNDNNINFKRYAPTNIKFVDDPQDADIQILNITRLSDASKIVCKKYVVLFHCRGEWSEEDIKKYLPIFEKALFVYSHQELPKELGNTFKFMRGPWGTDDYRFFQDNFRPREYKIMNTGMVAQTEAIVECLKAAENCQSKQIHVGRSLNFNSQSYFNAMNLKDEEMRKAYNSSEFVSGMRRIEGFEKPVIEGLLCGARPICFDTPLFRYWYDGIAEFVPECDADELVGHLEAIFKKGPRPVTDTEKSLAIKRFGWKNVSIAFWDFFA